MKDYISRNKRQVAIICERCETVFTITFEEYWHWDYTFGHHIIDKDNKLVTDRNGKCIMSERGWRLKKGKGGYPHHAHTPYAHCTTCQHCNEINLTKKEYRHIRRPPPTEGEYSEDRVKMEWE